MSVKQYFTQEETEAKNYVVVTACMVYTADSIRNRIGRPIQFEIRFERKNTIRRSLASNYYNYFFIN